MDFFFCSPLRHFAGIPSLLRASLPQEEEDGRRRQEGQQEEGQGRGKGRPQGRGKDRTEAIESQFVLQKESARTRIRTASLFEDLRTIVQFTVLHLTSLIKPRETENACTRNFKGESAGEKPCPRPVL